MTNKRNEFLSDVRFQGLKPFESRIWLSSPTMHGTERLFVDQAIQDNWVSTVGENIDEIEKEIGRIVGKKYAVALSSGTASLHLAIKLAAEKIYGKAKTNTGTLAGKKVFASDVTFDASVNPIAYEDGEAVFIDTDYDTWNMDPKALEKAFEMYPETKIVVVAHLYGTPGKMDEIISICKKHDALIVEDAAESLGAKYKIGNRWVETGSLGNFNCISFNGNKIVTGSSGGMFLTDNIEDAQKVRKWSTQSREDAAWYQHEELGYNYRMSNIIAGIVRGQLPFLDEHIAQKRAIWEKYQKGLANLPVQLNPWDKEKSIPNFWLSSMIIDENAMAPYERGEREETWKHEKGKSSPGEILAAISAFGAEGRPIWKPMHMQPLYRDHAFVTIDGNWTTGSKATDVGADIFRRGLCLPSDIKMTEEQQNMIIDIIHRCFL